MKDDLLFSANVPPPLCYVSRSIRHHIAPFRLTHPEVALQRRMPRREQVMMGVAPLRQEL